MLEPTDLPDAVPLNLYESPAMRTLTGQTIRPGGLTLTDRAMAFCRIPPGARVLDAGCGCGATAGHLQRIYGIKAMGLDLSRKMLDEASASHDHIPLIQGCAEVLPFKNESVTAVFCECVLSLIKPPEPALREWHRMLKPGGYLVLSDLYARIPEEKKEKTFLPSHCCLAGAVGSEVLFDRVQAADFEILLFEDHSELLKQLAAQMVWTYGSMAAFWSQWGGGCRSEPAGLSGRPGYFLMVARKEGGRHE